MTEYIVLHAVSLDIKKVDLTPPSGTYSILTKYTTFLDFIADCNSGGGSKKQEAISSFTPEKLWVF